MTGVHIAIGIALCTVLGLLLWSALVRAQTRISSALEEADTAPRDVPVAVATRVCESVTCAGLVPHVVLPCGAALCARCGTENPAPYIP